MFNLNGKRITFKRKRPNPLFEDFLEKLYEEAKAKRSKHEQVLKEALESLTKYPLPLKSGAECAILKGFNKKLCVFLDTCMSNRNVKKSHIHLSLSADDIEVASSSNNQVVNMVPEPVRREAHTSPNKMYKPGFKTGGYAILLGLLEHSKKSTSSISKDELIIIAQKYCEDIVQRTGRYSPWSNMGRLVEKGLVCRNRSKKTLYSLTEQGLKLANELWKENINQPLVNDIIFNDIDNVLNRETEIIVNSEVPQSIAKGCETNAVSVLNNELIDMPPGSYDVLLLIDKNENSGSSRKPDPFLVYPGLKYESRSLKVGDFTWIAKHKTRDWELVLPYIAERKRMDDLAASIKDGRFHEQKFRLRKCGLSNVIYLVESYDKNKHVGLPMPSLLQALANTRIQDGFKVFMTDSLGKSVRFLAMMTKRIEVECKGKTLKGVGEEPIDDLLMTFDYFNKASLKTKVLSVTDMFIKMLLQLKGMSVEKALAITSIYKTPKALFAAYDCCNDKEGGLLLANLKYGCLKRNLGPSVSKSVYQLFTLMNVD
ncbi:unnamed protein product [Leptidea sinapis]|uniref:Crossover junction endonuclease MUS81 n=1 Tax=Leptidea sinapis TaxID=189913 RepID=A0A5E4QW88_9NEOP|nr:unnamed protein product [Leptidea sinapis]